MNEYKSDLPGRSMQDGLKKVREEEQKKTDALQAKLDKVAEKLGIKPEEK